MAAKQIKIISWNVNGLRAVMQKNFPAIVKDLDADILVLQETKLQEGQRTDDMIGIAPYESFWSYSTVKKGYSGVAAYSRIKPVNVKTGIGIPRYDDEGRLLEMDFNDFLLFNIYFPNGGMSEERLQYKMNFYQDFFAYADALKKQGRSLIITGDFNTAHNEIDLRHPKANEKNSGFLKIEREVLDDLVQRGYVDTFRHFYPDKVQYSWWSYRFSARKSNTGWRIDYFFVTKDIIDKEWIKEPFILNDVFGSDHCPVGLLLEY
jgi:exodeoxyribonuclease-3